MTTAFVTGATGFVGVNLVDRLVRDGWEVTALHRASSDLTYLQRFAPGLAVGDVVEADSVLAAMPKDVDAVFHVAASTNFWAVNNSEQTRINVAGTRNVVRAALERGAKRFVHTSSIAAYAPESGTVLREDTPSRAADHWINYFRTKWLAEQEVRAVSLLKTLWSMQSLTFSRSGSGSPHRCFTCCTPYSRPPDRA